MSKNLQKWGAISGILFFVTMVARVILGPDTGEWGDGPTTLVEKVNAAGSGISIDAWVGGIAVALLVVFAAVLLARLGEQGAAHAAVVVGGIGVAGVLILTTLDHVFLLAAGLGSPWARADAAVLDTVLRLAQIAESTVRIPMALFAGAVAVAGPAGGVISRRVSRAGFGVAVVALVASASLAGGGLLVVNGVFSVFSLMLFMLWTLWAAVSMLKATAQSEKRAIV